MPISVPTPDQVRSWFEQAVTQAVGGTQAFSQDAYSRLLHNVVDPQWQQVAPGIVYLPAGDHTSLFRAQSQLTIINNQDSQERALRARIDDFVSQLIGLVPAGADVALSFEFPAPESVPFGQEVPCWVRGIIKG